MSEFVEVIRFQMNLLSKRRTTWLSGLVALLLSAFVVTRLQAQEPALLIEATPLYGGTVKYGEWLPVRVEVENQGEAQSGQLRIPIFSTEGTHYHAQRVELPPGARKAVTIPVIVRNTARQLTVEWLPEGATEPTTKTRVEIDAVPNIRFIIATITGAGEGLEPLNNAEFDDQSPARDVLLVPVTLETLPERAELLNTLDMIVLSGVDTALLAPAQRQALEAFVVRGGLLVLGGGPEAARVLGGLPGTLQPITLADERALDALPALAEWSGSEVRVTGPFPAASGRPSPTATVRLAQDDLPLVVEQPHGAGMVYWLALDPALSPFDAWAGVDSFWQRVLGERTDYPAGQAMDVSARQQLHQEMGWLLQELPVLDLPSLRLLAPLLVIYILVVGPLNYLLLRWKRRLEWAWVTIPLATLVFSVGAYGLGFQLRGSDIILNTVSLVQALPGSPDTTVYATTGLFSPANRTYTLAVAEEALVSTFDQSNPWGPPRATPSDGMTIVQGVPTRVEAFAVRQWEMQSIGLEGHWQIGGSVTAELAMTEDLVTGTLHNASNLTLRDAVLVLRNYFVRLGDLAPGQRLDVNFPLTREGQMSTDLGWEIFGEPGGSDRQAEVRRRLFSLVLERSMAPVPMPAILAPGAVMNDVSPLLRNANLRLVAWSDEAPLRTSLLPEGNAAEVNTTLLVMPLPLSFAGGEVNTPEGYLSGTVVEQAGGSLCYGLGDSVPSLTPDYRSAEIEWQLPPELRGMDVSTLTVTMWTDVPEQDDPAVSASLYDVATGAWAPIELGRLRRVENGERHVTPEGVVRLRVENQDVNIGGCHFFDLRVRGNLSTEAAP